MNIIGLATSERGSIYYTNDLTKKVKSVACLTGVTEEEYNCISEIDIDEIDYNEMILVKCEVDSNTFKFKK
jgi:hypothetical protein